MLAIRPPFLLFLLVSLFTSLIHAAPQQRNRNGNNRNGNNRNGGNTGANTGANTGGATGAATNEASITEATDGSTILDMTVDVNGVALRFKVSAPVQQFTTLTNIPGAAAAPNTTNGALGLNVLLHGDGGQSFFDFPNQAVQGQLMGVVILAPSENLLWGQRAGPPSGLSRDDGAADSLAVRDLILDVLPQVVAFDASNIFFTGVSGGALTLSGFFMPAHLAEFAASRRGTGVMLMCGALEPQVAVVGADVLATNSRIHFQSTQGELVSLQGAIPDAIRAYEALAVDAGLSAGQIGARQTVDNTPNGGHCEFDEQGFVSGIQLVADNFANIMLGGDGVVQGIDTATVLNSVVGNEDLQFAAVARRSLVI